MSKQSIKLSYSSTLKKLCVSVPLWLSSSFTLKFSSLCLRASVVILSSTFMFSCSLPNEPGPMPKELIPTPYEPMLNVFGVLRHDGIPGSSFFHVERIVTTEEMYEMDVDILIRNASVILKATSTYCMWTFTHADEDSMYHGYYYNKDFIPESGEKYELLIKADGYPDITADCRVPVRSIINSHQIDNSNKQVTITVEPDSIVSEYRLYLQFEDMTEHFFLQPPNNGELSVNWQNTANNPTFQLIAVEKNLRRYRTTSSGIIPQTYHEDGSTVSGGLGVFGAVTVLKKE